MSNRVIAFRSLGATAARKGLISDHLWSLRIHARSGTRCKSGASANSAFAFLDRSHVVQQCSGEDSTSQLTSSSDITPNVPIDDYYLILRYHRWNHLRRTPDSASVKFKTNNRKLVHCQCLVALNSIAPLAMGSQVSGHCSN